MSVPAIKASPANVWHCVPVIPPGLIALDQKTMYGGKYVKTNDTILVFASENDGRAETELQFKFCRRGTNKIGRLSDAAAAFLHGFF